MPGEVPYKEGDLLAAVSRGDEAAFGSLFHRYRDIVYSVARRLTGSAELAEEVVQDVFLKVWVKRETLAGLQDFSNYLFIISRNHIFSLLRQQARHRERLEDYGSGLPLYQDETYDTVLQNEYRKILGEAIGRLPGQQRQVYLLSREEAMSRDEIAAKMGISPETVKVHLSRATRFVRAYCLSRLALLVLTFCIAPALSL